MKYNLRGRISSYEREQIGSVWVHMINFMAADHCLYRLIPLGDVREEAEKMGHKEVIVSVLNDRFIDHIEAVELREISGRLGEFVFNSPTRGFARGVIDPEDNGDPIAFYTTIIKAEKMILLTQKCDSIKLMLDGEFLSDYEVLRTEDLQRLYYR